MTLYRTGQQRFAKYQAKYDPTTIGNRFNQVMQVALARAQEGLIAFEGVQSIVRPILDKYGISGTDRAKYLGFANKLLKHVSRASSDAAAKIASGLKAYYVTALGADPAVLDEIIQAVSGWVAPY